MVSSQPESVRKVIGLLRETLGDVKVVTNAEDAYVYGFDATPIFYGRPSAIIRAYTLDDVVTTLKIANEHRVPVIPRGHGSSLTGAVVPSANSIVLDLSPMRKVEVLPEDGIVKAEAGATVAEVDLECSKYGFLLPPDPASAETATIGGAIAEDAGGMRGARYGTFRNWVLSLTAVIPGGKVLKLGAPVSKRRMGYELMQLFIGSEGTLGVVVNATLKIIPRPERITRFFILYDSIDKAINTIKDLKFSKINPLVAEFMDRETIKNVNEVFKMNVPEEEVAILIDIDGYAEELDKVAQRVLNIIRRNSPVDVMVAKSEEEMKKLYMARRAAYPAISRRYKIVLIEDITVPLSKIPEVLKDVRALEKKYGMTFPTFGHIGDGNLHPNVCMKEKTDENLKRAMEIFEEICDIAIKYGGVVSGEHGIGLQKKSSFKRMLERYGSLELLEYMKTIKKIFDPNNIMNPGKVF